MFNSYQILKDIEKKLFTREEARITKIINQLVDKNNNIRKDIQKAHSCNDVFMYEGKAYRKTGTLASRNDKLYPGLSMALWPEMQQLLKEKHQVECDKGRIHQFMFRMYGGAFNDQQLRDATFDEIVDCLPDAARSLERRSQMNFFFNHAEDYREYKEIHPLVQFYSAARMLY